MIWDRGDHLQDGSALESQSTGQMGLAGPSRAKKGRKTLLFEKFLKIEQPLNHHRGLNLSYKINYAQLLFDKVTQRGRGDPRLE